MAVRGPANSGFPFLHHYEAVSVCKSKTLVATPGQEPHDAGWFHRVERQEPGGSESVVAAQEPAVTFRDHEGGCRQGRRIRKQAPKRRMVAIRSIWKPDECRCAHICLGPRSAAPGAPITP